VLYDKFGERWQTNPAVQATHKHQGEATLCSFVFTAGMEFKGIYIFGAPFVQLNALSNCTKPITQYNDCKLY